jgi:zinc transport system substrate-binding protein
MKKFILFVAIAAVFSACNSAKTKKDVAGNVVTVTILPEKTFVEKIAGNDFKINVLVPPGTSPESGNLLPSQLKDIANSDVWFKMGHVGFEYSWGEKIRQANEKMKVVDLSEGLDLIAEKDEHGNHVHETGIDPHIWLSPNLVKQMAKRILDELSILNPEKSTEYKTNYLAFIKEIDLLDIEIRNKLKPFAGRKIIVFHPSLSYFARDYDLDQYSLETGGKEPTPQQLMKVVDLARAENIKVIYIQSEFDRDHARVFAEEINGEIIQVRPLDPAWADNLREMTTVFVDNF